MSELVPSITPVITANSAYAAGNCIGGIQVIPAPSGPSVVLQSLVVSDPDHQAAVIDVLFFDALPSGGTYTDKVALALAAGDQVKICGKAQFAAADWNTIGGIGVAKISPGAQVLAGIANGGVIWMLLSLNTGTPTWTGTGKLVLRPGFIRA